MPKITEAHLAKEWPVGAQVHLKGYPETVGRVTAHPETGSAYILDYVTVVRSGPAVYVAYPASWGKGEGRWVFLDALVKFSDQCR